MGKQQGLSDFFLLKLQCVLYTPLSDTPSSSKQGMSRHLQGTAPRKQSWIAGILWIRCTGRINMHANRAAALNSSIKKWTFKGIDTSKSGFTWIYCTLTFITFQLFFTSITRFYKGIFFCAGACPALWPRRLGRSFKLATTTTTMPARAQVLWLQHQFFFRNPKYCSKKRSSSFLAREKEAPEILKPLFWPISAPGFVGSLSIAAW